MYSKSTNLLRSRCVVSIHAPGAGGYGDPLEIDPETVLQDVIEGYVSLERAREDYGVVIGDTGARDHEATIQLRRSLKTKRS